MRLLSGMLIFLITLAGQVSSNQKARQLLQETAQHYAVLDAYEFDGVLNAQIIGMGWELNSDVELLSPRRGSIPSGSPINGESQNLHAFQTVKAGKDPLPEFAMPPVGHFAQITRSMLDVDDLGMETIQINHGQVTCKNLRVKYGSTVEHPHPETVTYCICPETRLVYKQTFAASIGHHIDNVTYTLAFKELKFEVPTPQYLIDEAIKLASKSAVSERTEWIGKSAPDFVLPSLTGDPLKLSSLRGHTVLLDFWAIACTPCRIELPIVEDLSNVYRGRGVKVLGISSDEADKARAWLQKSNHSNQTLTDSDGVVSSKYTVRGIPSLVLIGRDGRVAHYWEGPPSRATVESAIEKSLRQ